MNPDLAIASVAAKQAALAVPGASGSVRASAEVRAKCASGSLGAPAIARFSTSMASASCPACRCASPMYLYLVNGRNRGLSRSERRKWGRASAGLPNAMFTNPAHT